MTEHRNRELSARLEALQSMARAIEAYLLYVERQLEAVGQRIATISAKYVHHEQAS
jgi:hypothetical protein